MKNHRLLVSDRHFFYSSAFAQQINGILYQRIKILSPGPKECDPLNPFLNNTPCPQMNKRIPGKF